MPTGGIRKPPALVALEGQRSHLTKAQLAKRGREPKANPTAPDPPEWLNRIARERWDYLAPRLEGLGILSDLDGDLLACYCVAWSEIVVLTAYLADAGSSYSYGVNGALSPRPEVSMLNRARDDLRRFGGELGIGAAARTRIEVKPPDARQDALAEIVQANTRG